MFFASIPIKAAISKELDKHLSLASLASIKTFLPDIDPEVNYDLLPISFNAAVVNRINRNDDGIDTQTALDIYKTFINKPIDVEHNRKNLVGVILTAGFSEFGTDKPLTEEEVKGMTKPFNITLGAVIWRTINGKLADLIEECSQPDSDKYLQISASWELGYDTWTLALAKPGVKNLEDMDKVTDPVEVGNLSACLKAMKGSGQYEGKRVYRIANREGCIAMGVGLTTSPAAEVKGVATEETPEDKTEEVKEKPSTLETVIDASIVSAQKNEEKISPAQNNDVIQIKEPMKIKNLADITDETLKTMNATVVSEFISEELKKASDDFEKKKTEQDTQLKAAQEKTVQTEQEVATLKETIQTLQASVAKLNEEKSAREKQEKFNINMASLNEDFVLSKEDGEIIAKKVKDMDDSMFASYKKELQVLLKSKLKANIATTTDDETTKKGKTQLIASEKSVTEVVGAVVDNSKKDEVVLPNGAVVNEPTLKQKAATAFAVNQWTISY